MFLGEYSRRTLLCLFGKNMYLVFLLSNIEKRVFLFCGLTHCLNNCPLATCTNDLQQVNILYTFRGFSFAGHFIKFLCIL